MMRTPYACRVDRLHVQVYDNRETLGESAGRDIEQAIRSAIERKGCARIILAAAPSQNETLAYLRHNARLDWSKVTAFHMDEYIGLPADAPQRFVSFLDRALFGQVDLGRAYRMLFDAPDPTRAIEQYGEALREQPIDVVMMGVGENGHIAFNDPGVADFNDPKTIKVVDLDEACRIQQVNDGCFARIEDVPLRAVTLTIPTIFSGAKLFCMVPGQTKARAVSAMLTGPVTSDCPASILREHPDCALYLDPDSFSLTKL